MAAEAIFTEELLGDVFMVAAVDMTNPKWVGRMIRHPHIRKRIPDLLIDVLRTPKYDNAEYVTILIYMLRMPSNLKRIVDKAKESLRYHGELEVYVNGISDMCHIKPNIKLRALCKRKEFETLTLALKDIKTTRVKRTSKQVTLDCANEKDMFLMEKFENIPTDDILHILFPGRSKPECFHTESFRQWLQQPAQKMFAWRAKPGNILDDMGFGGAPDPEEAFYRITTLTSGTFFVDEDSRNILMDTANSAFKATYRHRKRLGKLQTSMLGQAPGEHIYSIAVHS